MTIASYGNRTHVNSWKATMLPPHQRCSHEHLWFYKKNTAFMPKTDWRSERKIAERTLHQNSHWRIKIASLQGVTVLFFQKLTNDCSAEMHRENAAPKQSLTEDIHRMGIEKMSIAWRLLCYHYTKFAHINTSECTGSNSTLLSKTD